MHLYCNARIQTITESAEIKFSQEQLDKNKRGKETLERAFREEEDQFQRNKAEAPLSGKEFFDLSELKKYWSYRYEKASSPEEIKDAINEIERDYYLAGKQFLTMRAYGEYLMEMELYR
ncbi:hypothetical protein H5125_21510 [Shewanella sp. SR44-4]|jgi:hypothetical protein|uniref:hypothetical protein n=1 Tax=Shewanella sp. SR44-4 TaxID=2760935 RepID=UPI0016029AA7|nr:hypothetical protein [Shewanella sp. SR44-4]MBB1364717.1 hypothetical protein [Shewanella sp. SR44-4]